MAAARGVSPGGALLRTSRLFSLPAALPYAAADVSAATNVNSDSATLAFPTHQVITTPNSSRKRGDWGLKRPLPLKSTTKTSTPMLRIKQVDSVEHITDFSSAADHGMSLRKWQDMNIPITVPVANDTMRIPGKSVFEETMDFTAIKAGQAGELEDSRWKFSGPWLAGMTDGNFKKYLLKRVRNRRAEFRQFLKERLAADLSERAASRAQEAGEPAPAAIEAAAITDAQLTEFLRDLRNDRPKLYSMTGRFLDLAPVQPPKEHWQVGKSNDLKASNPYAQDGPPITHPSAGLSYLRTASYLDNHSLYGPQKSHSHVKARIVAPRSQVAGGRGAKLGVGGFVTDTPAGDTAFSMRNLSQRARELIPGIDSMDPNIEGGAKVYIEPLSAKVNSQGRVTLKVGQARPEAELVAKEMAGEEVIFDEPEPEPAKPSNLRINQAYRRIPQINRSVTGSAQAYGLDSPTPGSRTT
ncbi:mitochondrial ribosomal protein MRP51 [Phialemonium atrogriseum]|uniref:Mitochondrial ribosomal protein MRP51 n=1 Tax=Phialemonium atrogriseum TaxID=1093897 RepID=A0AAJ0C0P3_9PEZI|nr:mitochondrial ribosomal protein MRP51 [Phialemonium atrogriseum]KAK1767990.1 mitochondrial ribosomal protein MRP51 [Phialemonium atrogriseum]